MPLLSIIIVNWNSADYLFKCLQSVCTNVRNLDLETIVVDNASSEECGGALAARFPNVVFVKSETNIGFAGANNLGFKHARGDLLLFLNPDTEVIGNAVQAMASHFMALPDAGAMGCRLLNTDLSIQTSAIHRFPTIINQIFAPEYLRLKFPRLGFWGIRPLFDYPGRPVEVEAISGACMLVRRGAFEEAGGFTIEYFMYSEDIDLCYTLRQKGRKIYYDGSVSIVHHGGKSTKNITGKNANVSMMREATFRFLKKHRGARYAACYRAACAVFSAVRLAVLFPAFPFATIIGKGGRIRWSISKWESVLVWALVPARHRMFPGAVIMQKQGL